MLHTNNIRFIYTIKRSLRALFILAWYQATINSSVVADNPVAKTVSAGKIQENLDATAFKLLTSVSIVATSSGVSNTWSDNMELTYYASTQPGTLVDSNGTGVQEDGFYFAYYATSSTDSIRWKTNQISAAADNVDFWRIIEVSVTLDIDANGKAKDSSGSATVYSEAEALAMLAEEATANNGFSIAVSRPTNGTSRTLFMEAEKSGNDYVLSSGATATNSKTLADNQKVLASASAAKFYFLMYVDGTNDEIDTATTINGDIVVTTAAKHVSYTN